MKAIAIELIIYDITTEQQNININSEIELEKFVYNPDNKTKIKLTLGTIITEKNEEYYKTLETISNQINEAIINKNNFYFAVTAGNLTLTIEESEESEENHETE